MIPENLTLAQFIIMGYYDERTGLAIREANGEVLTTKDAARLQELTAYHDALLAAAPKLKLLPKLKCSTPLECFQGNHKAGCPCASS